ncbi:hypothetical protein GCM10022252_35840 [Streptosporangium oxazolinicum]|uniref:Uncharacterized protein n=1 Tax=Streptosporangium oxazolinicum TaxID=909287 RepID=A0ABP8AXV1_9ACTN
MTDIEDRLRDAMAAKAETVLDDGRPRALPSPRGLSSGARWWAPVAVAAAIAIVAVATVVGARTVTPPAPPTPAVQPTPHIGPLSPPVKQVWPGAVHEIPTKGPGGRVFKPDVFVTDRVVVGRGLTRNRLDGIWSYDVDRRRFTQIAPLKDVSVMNAPLVFGDGYVAWSAFRDRMTEIWAVPVTGGIPRRIASITAVLTSDNSYRGIDLAIAGGMAVWSPLDGGVYRAPLKGGKASLINGTRGYYLVDWPWAGWPERDTMVDHPITRPMEFLKNVLTGEARNANPPAGRTSWNDCGVTWCFNGVEAWRRDGTGPRGLPGTAGGDLYSGRFILLHQKDRDDRRASAVHDVATGRTGLLFPVSTRQGEKPSPTLYVQEGIFWFRTERGTQVLVNLNAAGR